MFKVIIDTNILINSSTDDFSYAWKIIELVKAGKIKAVASEKIIKENKLIVERQIKKEEDQQKIADFLSRIEIQPTLSVVKVIKADPEDDKFLACAADSQADFIISDDAHLLHLEKYKQTRIVTAKDFWFIFQGQQPDKDEEWKKLFKNIFGK